MKSQKEVNQLSLKSTVDNTQHAEMCAKSFFSATDGLKPISLNELVFTGTTLGFFAEVFFQQR